MLPQLELSESYWIKAGLMRAKLLKNKLKARVADSLIAQFCLEHDLALVTRDQDFRHYHKYFSLKLG